MKIKTRPSLNTLVSIGVASLILLSLAWSFREIFVADRDMQLVARMQKVIFERIMLRSDYLLHREKRAEVQWHAKSETLRDLFELAEKSFDRKEDRALLKAAREDFDAAISGFTVAMEGLPRQAPGISKKPGFSDAEAQLINQVFLKAYSLNDNINGLYESVQKRATSARNRGVFIVVLFIFCGIIVIVLNSADTGKTPGKRLTAPGKGVETIGAGGLDQRIAARGGDELDDLTLTENEIAAKLETLYTSVENLNEEIAQRKRVEEELHALFLRQEAILAAVPDIIMEVDNNKVYTWANSAGLEFFGPDVVGKEAEFYFEGQQDTYDSVQPLFSGNEKVLYVESWQRRKDGEKRLLAWWCRVLKDERGNVTGALSSAHDITERKKADYALRESETKYRLLHESMRDAFVSVDMQGRITDFNMVYRELLGYSPEELLGLTYKDITPEKWHAFERKIVDEQVIQKGYSDVYEKEYRKKDGTILPVELRTFLIRDAAGSPAAMWAIVRDITERKKSEELIRGILESVDDGFIVIDRNYRIITANRAFTEKAGVLLEHMIGEHCYEISHHCDAPCYEAGEICAVKQVFETGDPHTVIHTHYDAQGDPIYVETKAYPLSKDPAGEVMTVIEILVDITGRKKAEEALRASEHQYRQLVDNALVGVYKTTAEGKFLYVNDALARIFECENVDEMLRLPVGMRYKRPEDREAFLNVLKELGKVPYYELEVSTKTGKLKTIAVSAIIEGGFITGMVTDITERKHLEAQLRHAQKMEAVGSLAGGIAHDFNNVLNVIIGYGSMVLDKLETGSPSKGQMNEVLAAAERAANLTKRLLAFSRKQLADVKPIDANELITDIRKMLIRIIGEDIDFQLALTDRKLVVMADAGQLEQILMNLAANARDAMPKGGCLTIGTGLQEIDNKYIAVNGYGSPGMYALITIADTGLGMDAETQKKIFEPFFTTKGIGEGTGLGLAISYGIIKQHSGYIKVYSEPGRGTEFRIYLPLVEESALPDNKTEAPAAVKGGNETVLVAEDDAPLRKLAKIVLESFGYSVITAVDGEDAITKFMDRKERIDLVMLDMIMPKKNGKEVSEVLRKASPRIKILFASGYTMDTVKTHELTESGFDFIHKPVRPQDLLKKVREILDR